jgi:hypothetical protein
MILFEQHPLSTLVSALPYLNPGTGGLIVQLVLGALFAVGLTTRMFWSRIKKMLHLKPSEPEGESFVGKDASD